MTFEDLPSDIRTTPLTDPQLRADLIDLIVGEEDREFGSIAIWLCDEDLIGVQPMVCHQLGRATRAKTKRVLEVALEVAMGPLFVAVGRPGSPLFTRDDLAFANGWSNSASLGEFFASASSSRHRHRFVRFPRRCVVSPRATRSSQRRVQSFWQPVGGEARRCGPPADAGLPTVGSRQSRRRWLPRYRRR